MKNEEKIERVKATERNNIVLDPKHRRSHVAALWLFLFPANVPQTVVVGHLSIYRNSLSEEMTRNIDTITNIIIKKIINIYNKMLILYRSS